MRCWLLECIPKFDGLEEPESEVVRLTASSGGDEDICVEPEHLVQEQVRLESDVSATVRCGSQHTGGTAFAVLPLAPRNVPTIWEAYVMGIA
eukprot:CAMPEP_0115566224 /NCGR_PEP_ID=MMETSP0271-20121206/103476_1 /TAXON_ID=71861 /ORGANISM="Scrippsiella trochoidea, Strain CCMP3099" /LENGTH=91 /DNA_ID=CAMNT_0003000529 /DNA_START=42 /DNA_END=317 /DNA_ORIENTATION=-